MPNFDPNQLIAIDGGGTIEFCQDPFRKLIWAKELKECFITGSNFTGIFNVKYNEAQTVKGTWRHMFKAPVPVSTNSHICGDICGDVDNCEFKTSVSVCEYKGACKAMKESSFCLSDYKHDTMGQIEAVRLQKEQMMESIRKDVWYQVFSTLYTFISAQNNCARSCLAPTAGSISNVLAGTDGAGIPISTITPEYIESVVQHLLAQRQTTAKNLIVFSSLPVRAELGKKFASICNWWCEPGTPGFDQAFSLHDLKTYDEIDATPMGTFSSKRIPWYVVDFAGGHMDATTSIDPSDPSSIFGGIEDGVEYGNIYIVDKDMLEVGMGEVNIVENPYGKGDCNLDPTITMLQYFGAHVCDKLPCRGMIVKAAFDCCVTA